MGTTNLADDALQVVPKNAGKALTIHEVGEKLRQSGISFGPFELRQAVLRLIDRGDAEMTDTRKLRRLPVSRANRR